MKTKEMDDSNPCFRCTDENSNPRLLRCFHSFCPECLDSLKCSSSGVINFPDCSEQTLLNGALAQRLPLRSLLGKRILDINRILRQRSHSLEPCAGCPEDDELCGHDASSYCFDCQEFFCEACAQNHTHFRFAASHRLITGSAEKDVKPRDVVESTSRFCETHVEEREKLHCRECDECVCERCYLEKHDRCHQVELLEKMKDEMEKSVMTIIDHLRKRIEGGAEFLKRLEREERQLTRRSKRVEGELETRSCMVKEFVSLSVNDFLQQLDDEVRQRSEIHETVRRGASQQVADLEIFLSTMTRCLEKASLAHLVSINSGGHLQKVEREARDFSKSWHTMLLTLDESRELEDILGENSIGGVLGRFVETDSDDGGALDESCSGTEFSDEHGMRMDGANETIEMNETEDVEGDNGEVEVRFQDMKTTDRENIEDLENEGEI